jgi:hypothetical protein
MTMDDELRPLGRPAPDDELEHRLEAYARAQLTPGPARIARMRAQLLAELRERPAASPIRSAPPPLEAARDRRSRRRTQWLPTLLAAGLSVVLVGGVAFAGSQAGGPLYSARLWLEDVTLPADPASRLDGELGHLQARLDEAAQAAVSGNGGAAQAALDAYRVTIDRTATTVDGDIDRATHVDLVLGRHRAALAALATRLPPQAVEVIGPAIERTEEKINEVQSAGPRPGPGANPGGGPGGKPGDRADWTSRPGGRADRTPRPGGRSDRAPRPGGRADRTPRPGGRSDRTPQPPQQP